MGKKTLGQEMIEGLTEIRDAMREGVPLSSRFRVTNVKLDVKNQDIEKGIEGDTSDYEEPDSFT